MAFTAYLTLLYLLKLRAYHAQRAPSGGSHPIRHVADPSASSARAALESSRPTGGSDDELGPSEESQSATEQPPVVQSSATSPLVRCLMGTSNARLEAQLGFLMKRFAPHAPAARPCKKWRLCRAPSMTWP